MSARSSTRTRIVATDDDGGKRLDQVLASHVPGLSRRKARVLLDIGGVFVDGARVKVASRAVRPGQIIEANVGGALDRATSTPGRAARERDAEGLVAPVVYEDDDLVVVDKPPCLLTAPTPESDRNNLADLLARRPGAGPVWIVHRLDMPTSGVLVVAKTEAANRALSERFRTHDVEREYLAVLAGSLAEDAVAVTEPLRGKRAVTHVVVVERIGAVATLVRARLETGRSHQIRLHARSLGSWVLGDAQHGRHTDHDPPRLALHATVLGFAHPRTGEPLRFTSPLPADLDAWLEGLRTGAA